MRNRKILGGILLSAVVTIGTFWHGGFAMTAQASGEDDAAAAVRIEGSGFDTPDEAITAFAEALQEGNLDKMISTFAVESSCEHYSLADQVQRTGAFVPSLVTGNYAVTPSVNDLMAQMSVEGRRASIMSAIKMPLLSISADRMMLSEDEKSVLYSIADAVHNMQPYSQGISDLTLSQINEVVAALQDIPDFSGMTVSEPLAMTAGTALTNIYLSGQNMKNMLILALVAGADGYTERGILLEDEDEIYVVSMSIVRYGDKWYNYQLGGNISMLMNVTTYRQGILGGNIQMLSELYGDGDTLDLESAKTLLTEASAQDGAFTLQQLMDTTAAEYDQMHDEFVAQLQSGRDEDGNLLDTSPLDFSKPLIGQTEALKEAADNSGIAFYGSSLIDLRIMSFDELIDFFAL